MYLCERCKQAEARPKEKFCVACRKIVLAEMRESGYLQQIIHPRGYRPDEAKENVHETKHGTGHG